MTTLIYDAVAKLAEPLTLEEQSALIAHLQNIARRHDLTYEEWKVLFDALKDDTPIVSDISDRRSDWYDDEGR